MSGPAPRDLLAALLLHSDRVSEHALAACTAAELVAAAEREQVVPLASRALQQVAPSGPHAEAMHAAATRWTLREAAERHAIGDFLEAAAGVPMVFFKGAATAYSLYDEPWMRMKDDWDVLVATGAHRDADRALARAGFRVDRALKPGRVRMRQQSYRRDVAGGQCIVDLHQRALNPPALSDRIPYRDLDAIGVPLPRIHRLARGVAGEAALAIACVHRLAHHSSETRLMWDYEVLLLARRLSGLSEGAARLAALSRQWGGGRFVSAEVRGAAHRLDAPLDAGVARVLDALDALAPAGDAFLREHRSRADEFLLDWRVLGWKDRASLLIETFAPDGAFVRASTGSTLPLPWLYVRRIARGARGWFRRG